MKGKKNLLKQLKNLPYFDKFTVFQIGKPLGLKDTTMNTYISRFLKRREIFKLKRELFISADFFQKNKDSASYFFFLANILHQPSYVSSWAALQYYQLVTETTYGVTSVTPKATRRYLTGVGAFTYQSIQKELFSDFILENGTFPFFIASPAKALFDLLYFKTRQFRGFSMEKIRTLVEELRIDFDEIETKEQEKFYSLVKKYLPL